MCYTRRRARSADAWWSCCPSFRSFPLVCFTESTKGNSERNLLLLDRELRLHQPSRQLSIVVEDSDNIVCTTSQVGSDHERHCVHQCARTRSILARKPRTETSQIQAISLLLNQSGKYCLEKSAFSCKPACFGFRMGSTSLCTETFKKSWSLACRSTRR
jgi:hypothetical protein